VTFANASVVLSASLDGTVRAHDLYRYRTFKTLTTPTPVQFLSLAVDPSGEIVAAGSTDPFHIYAWNLQTGKLIDIFTGHAGPVCSLAFQATGGMLVSASWDERRWISIMFQTEACSILLMLFRFSARRRSLLWTTEASLALMWRCQAQI
jgi:WD40 repeat protein